MSTFASRHVSISVFLPFTRSLFAYSLTTAVASPCPRYSGRISSPSNITDSPSGSYRFSSTKNSSLNFVSLVDKPFKNPASFPLSLSTATINKSGALAILSFICFGEQASLGGKHICSISVAKFASSCLILLNSKHSTISFFIQ